MQQTDIATLVAKHRMLEEVIAENRNQFISDWNGTHPYCDRYLADLSQSAEALTEPGDYIFFDDQKQVIEQIAQLHRMWESVDYGEHTILAGPGASPILASLCVWLLKSGCSEVFYVPPLYYTLHFFLKTLGIRLRPVTGRHAFEAGVSLNLPQRQGVLLMTDPIWYAGTSLSIQTVEIIRQWQAQTRSIVVIDGSFQYAQWNGSRLELTSMLNPELTLRLISPTKSLGIPCYRFAYLLHPERFHSELLFIFESMVGGISRADLLFAQRAMNILSSPRSNLDLTDFLRDTFCKLIAKGIIETTISPDCGYFVFAEPKIKMPKQVGMTEDYFELKGYPSYVRINLMRAHTIFKSQMS